MDVPALLAYLKLPRPDVTKALDIILGFTTQKDFQAAWGKTQGATTHLVALACARGDPEISKKASKCLVNLAEDTFIRQQILRNKGVTLCVAKIKDITSEEQHELYVSLLANLTTDKKACMELVSLEGGKDLEYFFHKYLNTHGDEDDEPRFQYGGYVITNITQYDFGRQWLLGAEKDGNNAEKDGKAGDAEKEAPKTKKRHRCMCMPKYKRMNIRKEPSSAGAPVGDFVYHGEIIEALEEKDGWIRHEKGWTAKEWDGMEILIPYENNLALLLALTESHNPIRRLATFQTVRNCSLDSKLVSKGVVRAHNLLEKLLLPMVVPKLFSEKDAKGMPKKVITKNQHLHEMDRKRVGGEASKEKDHFNNSALVEDPAIKKAILETLIQFVRDDKMRRLCDENRVYVVLRELHLFETVKEIGELITHVQNFFILDKTCLQQPRDAVVQNEVWSSPDGPAWNGPIDPAKPAIEAAPQRADEGKDAVTAPTEKPESKDVVAGSE